MLAILQYATSGFWTFVGCAILLTIAADVVVNLAKVVFLGLASSLTK